MQLKTGPTFTSPRTKITLGLHFSIKTSKQSKSNAPSYFLSFPSFRSIMSVKVPQSQNAPTEVGRRSVNFHPTVWGDRFITYNNQSVDDDVEKRLTEELKAQVRRKLVDAAENTCQKLNTIDAIQRLGLAYHFETEIEEALQNIYNSSQVVGNNVEEDDLYSVALRFRLLRQQGYTISSDVFNKFKDDNENFKVSLIGDASSLLSLYEAAHLRIHGEHILDEALTFSVNNLESIATQLSPPLATQVTHALNRPLRKGIPRLEARHYISVYQEDPLHDEVLLKLAKLDFNQLQKIHQKELSEISKWWKDINFVSKLPFARDRVVECYFWIMSVHSEPENWLARRTAAKIAAVTSIIDDIYDVHGTIDELTLFTEAVNRWDINNIDQLPEYMKICYKALLGVFSELGEELEKQGRSYRLDYTIEVMKDLVRNYFTESKWLSEKYVPTIEEYMRAAEVSIGYNNAIIASFATAKAGDIATKDTFEWVLSEPKIVKASSVICRLMDDLSSHKFEQKRGHVASAIECYMKQHDAAEEKVRAEFNKQVTDAWKVINQECLHPTAIPMPLLTCVLNYARVADVMYKDGDAYTFAHILLKDHLSALFTDPIAM